MYRFKPAVFSLVLLSVVSYGHASLAQTGQASNQAKKATAYSEYTSLKEQDCQTLEYIEEQEGYYRASCPSKPPYQLEVEGGDLRYGLNIIYDQCSSTKIVRYWYGQFFSVGDTVEWRYRKQPKSDSTQEEKNYHALIYRVYSANYDQDGNSKPDKQELFVVRLAEEASCILGKIPASANMNVKARQLADDSNASCSPELNDGGAVDAFLSE